MIFDHWASFRGFVSNSDLDLYSDAGQHQRPFHQSPISSSCRRQRWTGTHTVLIYDTVCHREFSSPCQIGRIEIVSFELINHFSENIAFGLLESEATKERIEKAAKVANIHDFIVSLPNVSAII